MTSRRISRASVDEGWRSPEFDGTFRLVRKTVESYDIHAEAGYVTADGSSPTMAACGSGANHTFLRRIVGVGLGG